MSSILLDGPAVEPVSLAEAKAYLRVEHDDDDDTIAALIAGARVHVEAQTRRALITQTWRLSRDAWPSNGRIAVLPAPLRELVAARIHKLDGTTQAIDADAFAVDTIERARRAGVRHAARCRRRAASPAASSSTSKWDTATRRPTCPSRCARRSACWWRTGTRTAA